jgi:hypothetical protein
MTRFVLSKTLWMGGVYTASKIWSMRKCAYLKLLQVFIVDSTFVQLYRWHIIKPMKNILLVRMAFGCLCCCPLSFSWKHSCLHSLMWGPP